MGRGSTRLRHWSRPRPSPSPSPSPSVCLFLLHTTHLHSRPCTTIDMALCNDRLCCTVIICAVSPTSRRIRKTQMTSDLTVPFSMLWKTSLSQDQTSNECGSSCGPLAAMPLPSQRAYSDESMGRSVSLGSKRLLLRFYSGLPQRLWLVPK